MARGGAAGDGSRSALGHASDTSATTASTPWGRCWQVQLESAGEVVLIAKEG